MAGTVIQARARIAGRRAPFVVTGQLACKPSRVWRRTPTSHRRPKRTRRSLHSLIRGSPRGSSTFSQGEAAMPEWDHSETETSVDPRGLAPCMTIAHTGRTVGSYVCNKTFHYAEANLAAREHLKLYGRAALERRIQFTR